MADNSSKMEFPWEEVEQRLDTTGLRLVEQKFDAEKQRRIFPLKSYSALDWLGVVLPCTVWLRKYDVKTQLLRDVLAGLSVAAMVVPQGMSYAGLARLPPVYGLYGAFVPVLVYSLLGSSRQLAVGPVAVTSFILGSGLPDVVPEYDVNKADKNPADVKRLYELAAIQVAFLTGILYTAVGVFQLGFVINFISHPVVSGFCSGAAVLIGLSQVKFFLVKGTLKIGQSKENTIADQLRFLSEGLKQRPPPPPKVKMVPPPNFKPVPAAPHFSKGTFNWRELVMGLTFLSVLIMFKVVSRLAASGKLGSKCKWLKWLRSIGPLFVCVVGILTVVIGNLDDPKLSVIRTIYKIPAGLPKETASWIFPIAHFDKKISLALLVMVIDLLESTSIAKTVAAKNNYRINNTQEVVGLGIANVIGSLFHAFTTTGSFSRTALNNEVGATSQLSSFISAWIVGFVLLFMTPVFERLPYNATAAIIIAAVVGIFDGQQAWWYFKIKAWRDLLVWLAAFFGVVFGGVEIGLACGIGLSILLVLLDSAFPHVHSLGRLPGSKVFRTLEYYNKAQEIPGIVVFNVEGPLFFGNIINVIAALKHKIAAREDNHDRIHYVVFDLSTVPYIDGTAVHELIDLVGDMKLTGRQLAITGPNMSVTERLSRAGVVEELGKEWVFVDTSDAVCLAEENIPLAAGGNILRGDVQLTEYQKAA